MKEWFDKDLLAVGLAAMVMIGGTMFLILAGWGVYNWLSSLGGCGG